MSDTFRDSNDSLAAEVDRLREELERERARHVPWRRRLVARFANLYEWVWRGVSLEDACAAATVGFCVLVVMIILSVSAVVSMGRDFQAVSLERNRAWERVNSLVIENSKLRKELEALKVPSDRDTYCWKSNGLSVVREPCTLKAP